MSARCEYCNGSGTVLDGYDENGNSEYTECRSCDGTGRSKDAAEDELETQCPRCKGSRVVLDGYDENGHSEYNPCPVCGSAEAD